MIVSLAPAIFWLLATSYAPNAHPLDLPAFEREIAALPSAAKPVESCDRMIDLTNRLIQLGPRETRKLLEDYLAKQPEPRKSLGSYVSLPEAEWCQTLVLISLLISDGKGVTLNGATIVPGQYEDGLIFQSFFLYFPNELTPITLRGLLSTVDWEKFRKSPIVLKPERATDKEIRSFLTKRFEGHVFLYHYIAQMKKQNPPIKGQG